MRTRSSLLTSLVDDLKNKNNEFLGITEVQEPPKTETQGTKFSEIVRKVLRGRPQPQESSQLVKKPSTNNTNTIISVTPSVSEL